MRSKNQDGVSRREFLLKSLMAAPLAIGSVALAKSFPDNSQQVERTAAPIGDSFMEINGWILRRSDVA